MLIDLDQKISIRDRNRMELLSLSLLSKIVLRILEETMWSSSGIIKQWNYCFLTNSVELFLIAGLLFYNNMTLKFSINQLARK